MKEKKYIVGVDEAGRGPWAGPVYAAAVILPDKYCSITEIKDSKALPAKKRQQLFTWITKHALDYAIAKAEAFEIDQLNILNATLLAMQRAISLLKIPIEKILIDGVHLPKISTIPMQAVVKGDALVPVISAASILAKVARDEEMKKLADLYPQYGFEQHKGYGTKLHHCALVEHGPCAVHRYSFRPIREHSRTIR